MESTLMGTAGGTLRIFTHCRRRHLWHLRIRATNRVSIEACSSGSAFVFFSSAESPSSNSFILQRKLVRHPLLDSRVDTATSALSPRQLTPLRNAILRALSCQVLHLTAQASFRALPLNSDARNGNAKDLRGAPRGSDRL